MSNSTWERVHFWVYLLNQKNLDILVIEIQIIGPYFIKWKILVAYEKKYLSELTEV